MLTESARSSKDSHGPRLLDRLRGAIDCLILVGPRQAFVALKLSLQKWVLFGLGGLFFPSNCGV